MVAVLLASSTLGASDASVVVERGCVLTVSWLAVKSVERGCVLTVSWRAVKSRVSEAPAGGYLVWWLYS